MIECETQDGLFFQGTAECRCLRPVLPALLLDLNVQAADFLIQRGKRHVEALSSLGLIPVAALEHVDDYAPFNVPDNLEKRSVRGWVMQGQRRTASHKRLR